MASQELCMDLRVGKYTLKTDFISTWGITFLAKDWIDSFTDIYFFVGPEKNLLSAFSNGILFVLKKIKTF